MSGECENCKLWDIAAKENGYSSGMCCGCFEKYYSPNWDILEIECHEIWNKVPIDRKLSE